MSKRKITKEFVTLPLGEIVPYENNPRINDEAVKDIIASMKQTGNLDPIEVDENNVILSGHTRLKALVELRYTETEVMRVTGLTEAQKRKYRLLANKTSEKAEWDLEKLAVELEDMDFEGYDFGFDLGFDEPDEVIEDDYDPEPPAEPRAKVGDIYQLGAHRLMCGDSTSVEDVCALCNGQEMDMLLTDPPYNVDIREKAGGIINDNMSTEKFRTFLRRAFLAGKSCLGRGAVFHIWYGEAEAYNFRGACSEAGLTVRQQLIWVKNQPTLGRQDFQHQYEAVLTGDTIADGEMQEKGYEPCLYGWTDGKGHRWYKKRKEKDVLYFDKPLRSEKHPTMKPIKLFDYEMRCNTRPNDTVLDLFAGSGTTIIAAEQNGRRAFCMELDPKFVDVIIDRWEKLTGKKAVKISE